MNAEKRHPKKRQLGPRNANGFVITKVRTKVMRSVSGDRIVHRKSILHETTEGTSVMKAAENSRPKTARIEHNKTKQMVLSESLRPSSQIWKKGTPQSA